MSADPTTAWRPAHVTNRQIVYASVLAFLAWTFAVYDFILFGTLLPQLGADLHMNEAQQATLVTWVSAGAVIIGLVAGPVVDKWGRRPGMIFATAGAGTSSLLTALAAVVPIPILVAIRSLSGLGLTEQGINGAYLTELYGASDDPRIKKRQGFLYSIVQGGWPIGALLAAGLTAVLLPLIGWAGCFAVAAIPSFLVSILARRLRESPQFEAISRIREYQSSGEHAQAEELSNSLGITEHEKPSTLMDIFRGENLRTTLSLSMGHVLNYFPVQVFNVLGTTVLTTVHGMRFEVALVVLLLANVIAYLGFLFHGAMGDRFGRRNVIAAGWLLSSIIFTCMVFGPSDFWIVVGLYALGQFFLNGPYSAVLFFVGESYPTSVRGRGAAFVAAIGPAGAIFGSAAAAILLASGLDWQMTAFLVGAIPLALSGLSVLFARKRARVADPVHVPVPRSHAEQA